MAHYEAHNNMIEYGDVEKLLKAEIDFKSMAVNQFDISAYYRANTKPSDKPIFSQVTGDLDITMDTSSSVSSTISIVSIIISYNNNNVYQESNRTSSALAMYY